MLLNRSCNYLFTLLLLLPVGMASAQTCSELNGVLDDYAEHTYEYELCVQEAHAQFEYCVGSIWNFNCIQQYWSDVGSCQQSHVVPAQAAREEILSNLESCPAPCGDLSRFEGDVEAYEEDLGQCQQVAQETFDYCIDIHFYPNCYEDYLTDLAQCEGQFERLVRIIQIKRSLMLSFCPSSCSERGSVEQMRVDYEAGLAQCQNDAGSNYWFCLLYNPWGQMQCSYEYQQELGNCDAVWQTAIDDLDPLYDYLLGLCRSPQRTKIHNSLG